MNAILLSFNVNRWLVSLRRRLVRVIFILYRQLAFTGTPIPIRDRFAESYSLLLMCCMFLFKLLVFRFIKYFQWR